MSLTKTVVVKTEFVLSEAEQRYNTRMTAYDAACAEAKGFFASKPAKPKKPEEVQMLRTVVDEVDLQTKLDNAITKLEAEGYQVVGLTPIQSSRVHYDELRSKADLTGDYYVTGSVSFAIPHTSAIVILASKD